MTRKMEVRNKIIECLRANGFLSLDDICKKTGFNYMQVSLCLHQSMKVDIFVRVRRGVYALKDSQADEG